MLPILTGLLTDEYYPHTLGLCGYASSRGSFQGGLATRPRCPLIEPSGYIFAGDSDQNHASKPAVYFVCRHLSDEDE